MLCSMFLSLGVFVTPRERNIEHSIGKKTGKEEFMRNNRFHFPTGAVLYCSTEVKEENKMLAGSFAGSHSGS